MDGATNMMSRKVFFAAFFVNAKTQALVGTVGSLAFTIILFVFDRKPKKQTKKTNEQNFITVIIIRTFRQEMIDLFKYSLLSSQLSHTLYIFFCNPSRNYNF